MNRNNFIAGKLEDPGLGMPQTGDIYEVEADNGRVPVGDRYYINTIFGGPGNWNYQLLSSDGKRSEFQRISEADLRWNFKATGETVVL